MTNSLTITARKFISILTELDAEQGYLLALLPDNNLAFRLKLTADGSPIQAERNLIIPAITSTVLQTRQPVVIRNAMTDPRFANEWDVMRLKIHSVMCVPLWNEEKIVSLIYVENRSKSNCFTQEQLPLLEAWSDRKDQLGPSSRLKEEGVAPSQQRPIEEVKRTDEGTSQNSPSKRYILHESLGQGGMGTVHRATDRLTGEIVALKQVHIPTEQLEFITRVDTQTQQNLRLALAQEFQILASLRHPYIISVLDYGFDLAQQPFFTMTYLPKAQTVLEAGISLKTADKVDLIRQMLQALAYLHRRGVIHRDFKPSNVLVIEQKVRVLDFGLSISQDNKLSSTGGSLLYMAPEILNHETATQASDLYAAGVIAYELFAGHHPFDVTSEKFTQQVQQDEPDWTDLSAKTALVDIIKKLLAKKPRDRYESAEKSLNALNIALGETASIESTTIRESYLQAATFVGREREMENLQVSLEEAKAGQGSIWLIGGESGVGKSRLIEEFRPQALISGWQVMTGRAVDEGRVPYQLWRDIVPRLILNSTLNDLEAGILRQIAPTIDQLLERDIPEPPHLEGESAQQRLVLTLVSILQRQTQPTLLILEDLHWAREGLAPIKQILNIIEQVPNLMIIGTYRHDER
ncbi:MAG: protein kinase, partial [Chloroflexota bacterium]